MCTLFKFLVKLALAFFISTDSYPKAMLFSFCKIFAASNAKLQTILSDLVSSRGRRRCHMLAKLLLYAKPGDRQLLQIHPIPHNIADKSFLIHLLVRQSIEYLHYIE